MRIKPCHNIYLTCANEFIAPHRTVLLLSTFVLQFIDPADFSPETGGTKTQPTITETLPAKVKVPEYRKETSKEAVKKKANDAAAENQRIEWFSMVRKEDQQALKEYKKSQQWALTGLGTPYVRSTVK